MNECRTRSRECENVIKMGHFIESKNLLTYTDDSTTKKYFSVTENIDKPFRAKICKYNLNNMRIIEETVSGQDSGLQD